MHLAKSSPKISLILFLFSPSLNDHRRVSFYVIVEGKEDEDMVKQQEWIQMVEKEEDISIGRMKETLDKIQRIYRKKDIIKTQWERKQNFLQDVSKMEATLSKFYGLSTIGPFSDKLSFQVFRSNNHFEYIQSFFTSILLILFFIHNTKFCNFIQQQRHG